MFALKLEGEIVCQMPALVISSEQPQRIWVPYLEGPEIQDALSSMLVGVHFIVDGIALEA